LPGGRASDIMSAIVTAEGPLMGRVIVRDLDDAVIAALRERARARGVSLEQQLREVPTRATRRDRSAPIARLDRIRALTPEGPRIASEELIREDRDTR
jgi:antitoxin FitA